MVHVDEASKQDSIVSEIGFSQRGFIIEFSPWDSSFATDLF